MPCGQDNASGHWGCSVLLGAFMWALRKIRYHDFHIINRNERLVFILNHFVVSIIYCHRLAVDGARYIYGRHARNMAFKMSTVVASVLPTAVKVLRAFRLAHGVRWTIPLLLGFRENDKVLLACFYVVCYAKRSGWKEHHHVHKAYFGRYSF